MPFRWKARPREGHIHTLIRIACFFGIDVKPKPDFFLWQSNRMYSWVFLHATEEVLTSGMDARWNLPASYALLWWCVGWWWEKASRMQSRSWQTWLSSYVWGRCSCGSWCRPLPASAMRQPSFLCRSKGFWEKEGCLLQTWFLKVDECWALYRAKGLW